ncbi:type VII toxin-antitoxin system HepT family RNase toxin [Alkalihalobacterium sp. APHAB7]|uniref:type VII toxin-antitoxin system HepT family RNase toxin n=1 Tax=Alkalihalobacterium sp. APHAB7 TaxID=3402081 RepID=UPI003AAD3885
MNNDVIINKVTVIERCLKRINEEYANNPENLKNYTKQDSIILNIQRACEASIDLAMHLIATKKLGLPQTSREAFDVLHGNKIICESLNQRMKAMVGFRNIAIHDYQKVNLAILESILNNHLTDFQQYTKSIIQNKGE